MTPAELLRLLIVVTQRALADSKLSLRRVDLRKLHLFIPLTEYSFRGIILTMGWDVNPKRNAILLVGRDKTGDNRWYEVFVPLADRLYDDHLLALKKEGKI